MDTRAIPVSAVNGHTHVSARDEKQYLLQYHLRVLSITVVVASFSYSNKTALPLAVTHFDQIIFN